MLQNLRFRPEVLYIDSNFELVSVNPKVFILYVEPVSAQKV
jgi:hypothetical protein